MARRNNSGPARKGCKKMEDKKTCAVIGATPETLSFGYDEENTDAVSLKYRLADMIFRLIEGGFTDFISSIEQGVEMWSAEICAAMRNNGCPINLICVPTGENQANRWYPAVRERYFTLLENCTEVINEPADDYILDNTDAILVAGLKLEKRAEALLKRAKERGIRLIHLAVSC